MIKENERAQSKKKTATDEEEDSDLKKIKKVCTTPDRRHPPSSHCLLPCHSPSHFIPEVETTATVREGDLARRIETKEMKGWMGPGPRSRKSPLRVFP